MHAPAFWFARPPRPVAAMLAPLGLPTAWVTARRLRKPGWRAPVPVICCGNVGIGGAGKTTLALDLVQALRERGLAVHCLTRGYGGSTGAAVLRVDPEVDGASLVGDEALLLAQAAPCWVSVDRAAGARAAIEAGAQILLMDDGLQNPGLVQDWPLLVVDGAVGFGNGLLLPAGPLREPVAAAAARAAAVVLIGTDATGDVARLGGALPVLHAALQMDPQLDALHGQRLLAFAGIARPEKFFGALTGMGLTLAGTRAFADHHRFRPRELAQLQRQARRLRATLITTPKDAVRLPPAMRAEVHVAGVSLRWSDPEARSALLDRMSRRAR